MHEIKPPAKNISFVSTLAAVAIAVVFFFTNSIFAQNPNAPFVRVGVIYTDNCDDCSNILKNFLPTVSQRYRGTFDVISINFSKSDNKEILTKLADAYKVDWKQQEFPVLIVGKDILIGKGEIRSRLADRLEYYLARGGSDFLLILAELLSSNSLVFIFLLILLLISILVILYRRHRFAPKKIDVSPKASTASAVDRTLLTLIGRNSSSIDILNEIIQHLYWHKERTEKENAADAFSILQQLYSSIQKVVDITPLEKYGKKVAFDSKRHTTYDRLAPGEKATIVEVGWKCGNRIIKKALVKKDGSD